MAYAKNTGAYLNTNINDTLSATTDYWTNVGSNTTHSYASSQLTLIKSASATDAGFAFDTGASQTAKNIYYRFTWKWTTNNSNQPGMFSVGSSNIGLDGSPSLAFYVDMAASGALFAFSSGSFTAMGVSLANNTTQLVEVVVDRNAGTYLIYFDGTSHGPYTLTNTADANFRFLCFGQGNTAATWTYVISDVFLAKNTAGGGEFFTLSR